MSKKWPTWICVLLNMLYFYGIVLMALDVVPLVWNNVGLGWLSAKLEGLAVGMMFIHFASDGLKLLSEYLEGKAGQQGMEGS